MTTEADEFAQFASTLPAPTPETDPEDTAAPEGLELEAELKKKPEDETEKKAEDEKEDEKDKTNWAEVAAKEKAKREARAAKRATEATREEEVAALRAKAARLDSLLGKTKESKLEAMKEMGVSYDDLTEEYLQSLEKEPNKEPPKTPEQKRIEELEARIVAQEKREQEAERARIAANRNEIIRSLESQVGEAITTKAEDFEMLAVHPKGKEAVIKLLAAHHAENNGEVLTIQEACARIEAVLREKVSPYAKTKVMRALIDGKTPTTLSSDMREGGTSGEKLADDNKAFLETSLRLLKQQSPQ